MFELQAIFERLLGLSMVDSTSIQRENVQRAQKD
jgi:hypothetical protein